MAMNRLTLPRKLDSLPVGLMDPCAIPKESLPSWKTIPLDVKLPLISGPQGPITLTTTTKLGEKIHKCDPSQSDFNLRDPCDHVISAEYKPLHDPHLKNFLHSTRMKKLLIKEGFITESGQVICTLKEFNSYRQYLRFMQLLQMENERQTKDDCNRRKSRKYSTVRDSSERVTGLQEKRVKDVQERLEQKRLSETKRMRKILEMHKLKQEWIEKEKKRIRKEIEIRKKVDEMRRCQLLDRQRSLEHNRKMSMIDSWKKQDMMRKRRIHEINRKWELGIRKKHSDRWEWRVQSQRSWLLEEERRRMAEDENRRKHIQLRENMLERQREKQYEVYAQIREKQRREKERAEASYSRRLINQLKQLRDRALRKKEPKPQKTLKSTWDITSTLESTGLNEGHSTATTSDVSLGFGDSKDRVSQDGSIRIKFHDSQDMHEFGDKDSKMTQLLRHLGLSNFHGANFNQEIVTNLADEKKETEAGRSDQDTEAYEAELQDQAAYIVHSTLAIVTKIIFPAYVRYHQEIAQDQDNYPYTRPETGAVRDIQFGNDTEDDTGISDSEDAPDDVIGITENESCDALKKDVRRVHQTGRGVRFSVVQEMIPYIDLTTFGDSQFKYEDMTEYHDVDINQRWVSKDGEKLDLVSLDSPTLGFHIETDADETEQVIGHTLQIKDSLTVASRRMSTNSDLSAKMVRETLIKVIEDLDSGKLDSQQLFQLASFANQLMKCIDLDKDIDETETEPSTTQEVRSLTDIVDQIVSDVLNHTWTELAEGQLPQDQLQQMTVAFVTSAVLGDTKDRHQRTESVTSVRAQMIVEETLNKVLREIATGEMGEEAIEAIRRSIQFTPKKRSETSLRAEAAVRLSMGKAAADVIHLPALAQSSSQVISDGLPEIPEGRSVSYNAVLDRYQSREGPINFSQPIPSDTSLKAESAVRTAIGGVIGRKQRFPRVLGPGARSDTSMKAETAVHRDIGNVLSSENQSISPSLIKFSPTQKTSVNLRPEVKGHRTSSTEILGGGPSLHSDTSIKAELAVQQAIDSAMADDREITPAGTQSMPLGSNDQEEQASNPQDHEGFVKSTLRKFSSLFRRSVKDTSEPAVCRHATENIIKTTISKVLARKSSHEELHSQGVCYRSESHIEAVVRQALELALTDIYRHGLSDTALETISAALLESDTQQISTMMPKGTIKESSSVIDRICSGQSAVSVKASQAVKHVLSEVLASIEVGELGSEQLNSVLQVSVNTMTDPSREKVLAVDDITIKPVIDGQPINIDATVVAHGLSAISLRNPHLANVKDIQNPEERNSFRSLFNPDIKRLKGIDKSSKDTLNQEFRSASLVGIEIDKKLKEIRDETDAKGSFSVEVFAGSDMSIHATDIGNSGSTQSDYNSRSTQSDYNSRSTQSDYKPKSLDKFKQNKAKARVSLSLDHPLSSRISTDSRQHKSSPLIDEKPTSTTTSQGSCRLPDNVKATKSRKSSMWKLERRPTLEELVAEKLREFEDEDRRRGSEKDVQVTETPPTPTSKQQLTETPPAPTSKQQL